jgi:hypothetical protein
LGRIIDFVSVERVCGSDREAAAAFAEDFQLTMKTPRAWARNQNFDLNGTRSLAFDSQCALGIARRPYLLWYSSQGCGRIHVRSIG